MNILASCLKISYLKAELNRNETKTSCANFAIYFALVLCSFLVLFYFRKRLCWIIYLKTIGSDE